MRVELTLNRIIIVALISLSQFGAASAVPGGLDPTFGSGGIVTPTILLGYTDYYWVAGIYAQVDGKIVTTEYDDWNLSCWTRRFNVDGTPDLTYGTGGTAPCYVYGRQSDGRFISVSYPGIYRFDHNMTPTSATPLVSNFGLPNSASALVQPDDKILVWGYREPSAPLTIKRFMPDGSIDASFGTAGSVNVDTFGYGPIGVQPDGKVVVRTTAAIIRLNTDGSRDQAFGNDGDMELPTGNLSRINVVIQPDGKIVHSFTIPLPDYMERWIVRRFNANGTADTSFGINGEAAVLDTYVNELESTWHLLIQPNNRIVLAGRRNGAAVLLRLNSRGARDNSFGAGGIADAPVHVGLTAVSIAPNNKVVGAGLPAYWCDCYHLARFDASTPKARFDFDGDARSDVSIFRPSEGRWYIKGSYVGWFEQRFGLATDQLAPADFDADNKTDIAIFRDGAWWWINSADNAVRSVQFGQSGDIPMPADFTGDGQAELAAYRGGQWWTLDLATGHASAVQFGLASDKPVVGDYDGDGSTDQAVYRNGEWHLNRTSEGYAVINFGLPTDIPLPADYDGDGKTDVAVYREGTWYILRSMHGFQAFQFGLATDIPAPADYDGDGMTDAAIYRNGTWHVRQTSGGVVTDQFGVNGDRPVPAAYNPQ